MLGVMKITKVQTVDLILSVLLCDLQVYPSSSLHLLQAAQFPSLHSLQQLSLLHPLYSKWTLQWSFSLLSTTTNGRRTWRCSFAPKDPSNSQWRQRQSRFIMLTKKNTGLGLMKHMDACSSQSLKIFSSTSMD